MCFSCWLEQSLPHWGKKLQFCINDKDSLGAGSHESVGVEQAFRIG